MTAPPGHPRSGFSLVELALVIATMGIIAAIAVPKLGGAADRAKATAVVASVAQLQRSVDLYTAEHAERNPVTEPDGSATTSGVTLVQRLMRYTDDLGNVGASGYFGPYIRGWPTNPYNGKQTIRIGGAAAGANTHGWRIDLASLKVEADHNTGGAVVINGGGGVVTGGGGLAADGG